MDMTYTGYGKKRKISHHLAMLFTGITFLLLSTTGCGRDQTRQDSGDRRLQEIKRFWNECAEKGDMDLLTRETRPFLDSAITAGDSASVLYAATAMAQGFIVDDILDSVKTYLDFISRYAERYDDPKLQMVLQNVKGCYALKADLDYSRALACFMDGYEASIECRDSLNSVIMLSNIVSIYFARNDKNGIEYAERALQTVSDLEMDGFTRCVAYISMAEMLFSMKSTTLRQLI